MVNGQDRTGQEKKVTQYTTTRHNMTVIETGGRGEAGECVNECVRETHRSCPARSRNVTSLADDATTSFHARTCSEL
jgi:hypothetical protein